MPAPTDPYESVLFNMVHAHQTFKLGLNNILRLLENPPADDMYNFLGYCEAWADAINGHHNAEEIIVFPFLNQKLDFSSEIAAHEVIHASLDELLPIFRASQLKPDGFDAATVKEMIIKLRDPLFKHLDEELVHIAPENLKVFEAQEVQDMLNKLFAYAHGHDSPWTVAPFMLSHTAPEHKDSWPEMPWALRKIVVPYVLATRHYGYWKYSPYGF